MSDWEQITVGIGTPDEPYWQHVDNPFAISPDEGETYYLLNAPVRANGAPVLYRTVDHPVPPGAYPQTLEQAVFQALGTASVCWESLEGTGVFDDVTARKTGDDLVAWINEHYTPKENVSA